MSQTQRRLLHTYVPLAALSSLLITTGCTSQSPGNATHANLSGTSARADNFVSMAPSNTELIYALHADNHLIGVCTQCDQPPAVKEKEKVGSFVSLDLERLARAHPQVAFLVDGQETLAGIIEHQSFLHCTPVVLHNKKVSDVAANLRTIGHITGHEQAAQSLATAFDDHVAQLQSLCASGDKPSVFFCVWPTPLMTAGAGSYLNDAVTICGATNIAASLPPAYASFGIEQLLTAQPDVIVLPHEALGQDFYRKPPWTSLHAVANKRVYFLPDRQHDYLSRPTLKLVSGLYWLAKRLHPEAQPALTQQQQSIKDDLQPFACLPDE